jgi:hypothetical protein
MVRCVVISMLIVYALIAASFLSFYSRYPSIPTLRRIA